MYFNVSEMKQQYCGSLNVSKSINKHIFYAG